MKHRSQIVRASDLLIPHMFWSCLESSAQLSSWQRKRHRQYHIKTCQKKTCQKIVKSTYIRRTKLVISPVMKTTSFWWPGKTKLAISWQLDDLLSTRWVLCDIVATINGAIIFATINCHNYANQASPWTPSAWWPWNIYLWPCLGSWSGIPLRLVLSESRWSWFKRASPHTFLRFVPHVICGRLIHYIMH